MSDSDAIVCACGCGGEVARNRKPSGQARFINGHQQQRKPMGAKFFPHFTIGPPGECWEWAGTADAGGYGVIRVGRASQQKAHRYSYELFVGPIPKGMVIDHLCENPPCVNPAHLEPVTQAENVRRAYYRQAHESVTPLAAKRKGSTRLTWPQVDEIRRRVAAGEAQTALARAFGVTPSSIYQIVHNKAWRTEWRPATDADRAEAQR